MAKIQGYTSSKNLKQGDYDLAKCFKYLNKLTKTSNNITSNNNTRVDLPIKHSTKHSLLRAESKFNNNVSIMSEVHPMFHKIQNENHSMQYGDGKKIDSIQAFEFGRKAMSKRRQVKLNKESVQAQFVNCQSAPLPDAIEFPLPKISNEKIVDENGICHFNEDINLALNMRKLTFQEDNTPIVDDVEYNNELRQAEHRAAIPKSLSNYKEQMELEDRIMEAVQMWDSKEEDYLDKIVKSYFNEDDGLGNSQQQCETNFWANANKGTYPSFFNLPIVNELKRRDTLRMMRKTVQQEVLTYMEGLLKSGQLDDFINSNIHSMDHNSSEYQALVGKIFDQLSDNPPQFLVHLGIVQDPNVSKRRQREKLEEDKWREQCFANDKKLGLKDALQDSAIKSRSSSILESSINNNNAPRAIVKTRYEDDPKPEPSTPSIGYVSDSSFDRNTSPMQFKTYHYQQSQSIELPV